MRTSSVHFRSCDKDGGYTIPSTDPKIPFCMQMSLCRWSVIITKKDGNCDALQLEAAGHCASCFPLWLWGLYQVWSRFYCWYLTLCCNLTFWPWTFVVYTLWCDQTLYHILGKLNNPWLTYSDLNVENLGANSNLDFTIGGCQSLHTPCGSIMDLCSKY